MAISLAAFSGCGLFSAESITRSDPPTLQVFTSIYPIQFFVEQVGREKVTVTPLVSGGDIHFSELTPRQLKKVNEEADLVFAQGGGLEHWLPGLRAGIPAELPLVIMTEAPNENAEKPLVGNDPHIWLEPNAAARTVLVIRDRLSRADPNSADFYARNARQLLNRLAEFDTELRRRLPYCANQRFLVSHDAWQPFAEAYGLTMVPIIKVTDEHAGPSAAEMRVTLDRVKADGFEFLLQESSEDSVIAEALIRGADLKPLAFDSLEQQPATGDYFSTMRQNIDHLFLALACPTQ